MVRCGDRGGYLFRAAATSLAIPVQFLDRSAPHHSCCCCMSQPGQMAQLMGTYHWLRDAGEHIVQVLLEADHNMGNIAFACNYLLRRSGRAAARHFLCDSASTGPGGLILTCHACVCLPKVAVEAAFCIAAGGDSVLLHATDASGIWLCDRQQLLYMLLVR